jgi:hypothetical protein
VKTELFPKDYVPELNNKNLVNYLSFLTITHSPLSALLFGCYGIFMIDITAEFCFEQGLNRTSHLGLGLAETPEVPNIILAGNSLSFPMVY